MSYDSDVVIVGAGVAGALAAYKLAKAGLQVIILEAGPAIIDRSKHIELFQSAEQKTPDSAYKDYPKAPRPKVTDLNGYYIQKGSDLFKSTYERIVGGTTWHWLGTSLRLLPEDFKLYSHYKVGVDWPLSYKDIEPFYNEAELELGVSGNSLYDLGSPRSQCYKNPAIKQSYLDKVVSKALEQKYFDHIPLEVRATPQARQPWCQGSHNCVPMCPIGAKYEANNHINMAKALGTEVIEKAVVHHLDINERQHIAAVRYLDWSGKEHKLRAKNYIIAANAIETAKLLLMSKSKQSPCGVANSSGLVGRNLMDHPIIITTALSKEPVYPYRGPLSTSGIESFRRGDFRANRAAFRTQIGNDGWAVLAPPSSSCNESIQKGMHGSELNSSLQFQLQRQINLMSLIEQLPNPNNRIIPSKSKSDDLGIPRPELTYQISRYEHAGFTQAKAAHSYIFECLDATEINHYDSYMGAGHIMGTYRMGHDRTSSVVNRELRSHDHHNLFLLGSGVFPTVGTANPTLTIAALSLRTANIIAQEWESDHLYHSR